MGNSEIILFFDESGKRNSFPATMGALSIPQEIYNSNIFNQLNKELRNGDIKFHWNEYSGFKPQKKDIISTLKLVMECYSEFLNFNIINYSKPTNTYNNDMFNKMIYSKLPERVLYGLLRGYGKDSKIQANIIIEYATEYEKNNLNINVKRQLNELSLYRGERFKIDDSTLCNKNQEIGLELTDLILGIIRTILLNHEVDDNTSKGKKERIELTLDLLQINEFYTFLKNLKYFEWTSDKQLNEVYFKDYIMLFLAKQTVNFGWQKRTKY
ncbi:DUF3800 domain-containing protein [Natranaerobius trueperi]|uniref:DUF3800 domain-containing protein n=1 Tax=Natranaerobius trueperi TaxID=759412 RepID=A0A226BWA9_9FIRM|nr:DUF3800 domain-containing protein [Natranaerobius trueperi]OWZ83255.1 hypothetical protein CDO51_09770 [Natranaerobius trueperi]